MRTFLSWQSFLDSQYRVRMVQPQQVIDVSAAAAPAVVPANASDASDSEPEAQVSSAPQIKPLLRTVVTRARRSGLRLALGVIFFFGFASLVLTARSTSFSRAWHSSFSSVRSSGASILRSTTRTVVPVLVHREQDDQLDSNATDDESIASAAATATAPVASSHVSALSAPAAPSAPAKKLELRTIDSGESAAPTFALLRVIGNALPPRHDPARTLQNLRFILEHEQLEDGTGDLTKHWVVNRIIDSALAADIRALLQSFNASFTEIPFDLEAYAQEPYRVVIEDNGVDSVHAARAETEDGDDEDEGEWVRVQNQNEIMDAKNRYAFSVNAARNVMIRIGQRLGARWILPWDQNCFLTPDAWRRIKTDLTYQDRITAAAAAALAAASRGSNQDSDDVIHELKYFLTPMERLVEENDIVLSPDYTPNPWEEPQLIFRSDALERFDERFRYGKRDKVALLVRLGVPGIWTEWGWSTWELKRTFLNISRDIENVTVPQTGYVVRLFSGVPDLDTNDEAAAYFRELTRGKAVVQMLESLDDRVMRELVRYHPEMLTIYNASALAAMQRVYKARGSRGTLEQLMHDAAKALVARHARARWTVTANAPVAALDHAANVFATDLDAEDDTHDDGHVLQDFVYNTTALTLAWQLTGEARFADLAIAALDAWCVNDSTMMEPLLDFADISNSSTDASTGGAASGIRHTAGLPYLLDAVRLLFYPQHASSSSNATLLAPATVPDATRTGVLAWFERLYTYLQTAEHPRRIFRAAPSLYGLQYDLQVAALASFLNDSRAYRYTLGTLQGRLVTMVDASSGELLLPIGVAAKPYTLLSLATWGNALDAAQRLNMTTHLLQFDLTEDETEETTNADGGLLCRMVAAHIPCCQASPTASGACVALLQDALPVHLFIYQRLVRRAVQTCTRLAALPTCTSVASLTLALDELSSHELRRYSLAPYPYLT